MFNCDKSTDVALLVVRPSQPFQVLWVVAQIERKFVKTNRDDVDAEDEEEHVQEEKAQLNPQQKA